eukprot:TRINITY_DN4397_c0_g1_i1.p1 TRINITY_DN4397_c0_g1~~TRINITY_DN4397_c0_g1_i1.p1  ORF type:complete len:906 (+),score=351.53 TRINITY_DN4397_c0_g1_i1:83-2800(+)
MSSVRYAYDEPGATAAASAAPGPPVDEPRLRAALGSVLFALIECSVLVAWSATALEGDDKAVGIAVSAQSVGALLCAAAVLGLAPRLARGTALCIAVELLVVAIYFFTAHGAGCGSLYLALCICSLAVAAACAPSPVWLDVHGGAWVAGGGAAFVARAARADADWVWLEDCMAVLAAAFAVAAARALLALESARTEVHGCEADPIVQAAGAAAPYDAEAPAEKRATVTSSLAEAPDVMVTPNDHPDLESTPGADPYRTAVGDTSRDGSTSSHSPRLVASPQHSGPHPGALPMHSPREMRKDPKKREDGKLDYKKGLLLGQGAFGKVHIALMGNGDLMAVKNVIFSVSDPEIKQKLTQLQNEINTMKKLEHPHIIRYVATEKEGTSVNIFMEYVPGGSLMDLLKQFGALPLSTASFYTRQILEAVAYLHSESVVHRDIKCANIMITVDGTCKLGDFGAATLISGIQGPGNRRMSFAGTPFWMAPEVVRQEGEGYSNAIDIWSVGCTVIEMVTGQAPFSHAFRTQLEFLRHVVDKWLTQDDLPDLPEGTDTSDELDTFLWHCLQLDPATRPPASDLLLTEWAYWSVLEEGAEPPMSPLNAHSPRKLKAATANRETLGEMYAHWREWAAGRAQRRKVLTMVFEVIVSGTENVLRLQYFTKLKRYAIRDFDERAENWQHLKALQRRDVGEGDAYLKANQRMRRIQSFLMEKSMPALESVAERDQRKASAAPRDGAALLKRRVRHLQIAAQLGDAGEADPEEAGVGLDLKISRRSFMLPKGGSTVQGGKRTMRAKSFRRRESGAPSPTVGVSRRGSTTSTPPPLSARPPMPRLDSEYLGAQIGERVQQIYIHPSHDADIPILALSMTHTEPARSSMSSHTAQLSPSSTASPSSPGQRAERFGTVSFLDAD